MTSERDVWSLLDRLAIRWPIVRDESYGDWCVFCETVWRSGPYPHTDDCPWIAACDLLGRQRHDHVTLSENGSYDEVRRRLADDNGTRTSLADAADEFGIDLDTLDEPDENDRGGER